MAINPEESNLCKHAKREMQLAGFQPDDQIDIMKMIEAFASARPSGGQAPWLIHTFVRLAQFENLTALTSNPDEWIDRSDVSGYPVWQSTRNSEAFSEDGGKTYYLLSEKDSNSSRTKLYTTVNHLKPMG